MDKLAAGPAKDVWIGTFALADDFLVPFGGKEFALMLVSVAGTADDAQRMRLARLLVKQGCRYAVCAGVDSQAWETAFDRADLEQNPHSDQDRLVMTTSHSEEPLDEVAWFFAHNTQTPHFSPKRFLAVAIGDQAPDVGDLRSSVVRALGGAA